jgi:hypothetical protein
MSRSVGSIAMLLFLLAEQAFSGGDSVPTPVWNYAVTAGFGVIAVNSPDIAGIINGELSPVERIHDLNSSPEFFTAFEVRFSEWWSGKAEFAYLLKSFDIPSGFGPVNTVSYDAEMPTIIVNRLLSGPGYVLKFGVGVGYHFAHFTQNISGISTAYRATGPGVKLEVDGNTKFDDHLYGDINVELRGDFLGILKDDGGHPLELAGGGNGSMGFTGAGVRFGLSYFF